jgi:hypothetical protein
MKLANLSPTGLALILGSLISQTAAATNGYITFLDMAMLYATRVS